MSKDPAFLFYPSDFNDGTQDFTNEEVGAYIRLLLFQFSQGHLPLGRIKRRLADCFEAVWPVISSKFIQDENGDYFNQRLEDEQTRRKNYSDSRKRNISKRYEEKEAYISATHILHMENENENEIVTKDENENVKTVEDRKTEFMGRCGEYVEEYGQTMVRQFFEYWTEMNEGGKKMRYEKEKTFELAKRLGRWSRNNFNKGPGKQSVVEANVLAARKASEILNGGSYE